MADFLAASRSRWRRYWLVGLYALIAVAVALQRYWLHKHNVFLIFRASFFNLLSGVNLYTWHPEMHGDLFRYSPTFALLFGPLALLPVALGLVLWCEISFMALYVAVRRLLPESQARLVLLLVLGDLVRSMQSSQTNAVIAALMIAAFLCYERERPWPGAWAVAVGAVIKVFPAAAGLFALLRRGRVRALGAIALAGLVLLLLPLPITGPHQLLDQYRWWLGNERGEVFKPMNSVMDLMDAWTGAYWRRWPVQLAGLVGLLVPVALRRDAWGERDFRRRVLCSLLCFSVLFNHGAEAPTYVISTTGIAIWYASGPRDVQHGVLMLLTLLIVTVGGSSLVPGIWRDRVLNPAQLKVVPVLASWIWMQAELLRFRASGAAEVGEHEIAAAQAPA